MKNKKSLLKLAALAACLLPAVQGVLQAGAPLKINFQGRLDESGQPAAGSKTFVFTLYDAASGGNLVWTSQAQALALTQGVFSAVLSAGTPVALSTATFAGARYVEITVDGVSLSPRQEMVSAPYALVAQALAPDAVLPPPTITAGSVTDIHVVLTTAAIASGKFSDDRLYLSTGAFYGGFNGADQLVQLDNGGKMPGVDGSALTSLNPANLSGAVVAAKGGTGLTAPGASGNMLRSDGTSWTSWTPTYLASYTETDPVFLAQKGAASGVAPLGANSKINTDYIAGTIVSTHIADSGISAAKITSGVLNENRVIISTGAFLAGSFNGADQLVQLDAAGKAPALSFAGAVSLPVAVAVSDAVDVLVFNLLATHSTVLVDAALNDVTVVLPTAAGITGRVFTVKRVNDDMVGGTVFVTTTGIETLDGYNKGDTSLPYEIGSQWDFLTMQSDGTNWMIISR